LRNSVRDMKINTVERIEEIADQFEEQVKQRGGKVFRAKDGDALKQYLLNLCKEKGVKRIAKV
jgi:L-lactate dehydrogenase complex protein LldF